MFITTLFDAVIYCRQSISSAAKVIADVAFDGHGALNKVARNTCRKCGQVDHMPAICTLTFPDDLHGISPAPVVVVPSIGSSLPV